MSYPFDQIIALAGANRELAITYTRILSSSGERQAAIATRAFGLLAGQGEDKGATTLTPNFVGLTEIWRELEESRKTSLEDGKAAFEAWRKACGDGFSPDQAQQQLRSTVETWSSLFVAPLGGNRGTGEKDAKPAAVAKSESRSAPGAA